jgi:acyl-coenzyme A thioesterase PaaI-like protein
VSIVHHDLCFGCGRANLFGLQIELDPTDDGVSGRFFVKQDHQGPPGVAHGGIVAAALDEAMSLAVHAEGVHAWTGRLELDLLGPAPVGTFVRIEARIDRRDRRRLEASAIATAAEGGERLAAARATFVRAELRAGEGVQARPGAGSGDDSV